MVKNKKDHHLEQRNGTWFLRLMVNGVRRFEALSSSVLEARKIRDQRLTEIRQNGNKLVEISPPGTTLSESEGMLFGDVVVSWSHRQSARIKQEQLKSSTWRDWRSSLNSKVLPAFGDMPIKSIGISEVESFIAGLECGPKRINNILVPLRGIFKYAKRQGYISENPMADIDNLKVALSDVKPFTLEEVMAILQAAPILYRSFFTVAFYTGMRFGEMAALKWHQVDFNRQLILVRETRVYGEEGRTKTSKSKRDIEILPPVNEALELQKRQSGKDSYVFRDRIGKPMNPDHFREVVWKPVLSNAGLAYRPPMQTRHTFATLMIDTGEDLGWVQRQLGHGSLQMIYTRYYSWVKKVTRDDGGAFMKRLNSLSKTEPIGETRCV